MTSVVLGEYLAGSIIVSMLGGIPTGSLAVEAQLVVGGEADQGLFPTGVQGGREGSEVLGFRVGEA